MTTEPLDYPGLLQRCMGKRDLAERLVLKFVTQTESDVRDIARALQRADAAALVASAHRLKGASANICAECLRQVAAELETLGRAGNLAPAGAAIERLQTGLEHLKSARPRRDTLPTPA